MKSFAWGIASASYQSEDSITDKNDPNYFEVDWDLFAQAGRLREPRGMATYSWSEVDRDIEAIKSLNLSHYRFGIEWARIEPQPGKFNDEALSQYVNLAKRLKAEGITPIVCLWHFNFPSWLTNLKDPSLHGWFHPDAPKYWELYVKRVLKAFGEDVIHWMPQNEPNTYAFLGYLLGLFPPGQRGSFKNFRAFMEKAAKFYNDSADWIHQASPKNLVISVQNIIYWKKSPLDFNSFFWEQSQVYNFLHLDLVKDKTDIMGFNYYFKLWAHLITGPRTNDPEGMRYAIKAVHDRYKMPIWITENGMQEKGDEKRPEYFRSHIGVMQDCIKEGIPVEAYFAWCLVDNFEWCQGYRERFGLFTMDPKTRKLTPKGSAKVFGDIVRSSSGAK